MSNLPRHARERPLPLGLTSLPAAAAALVARTTHAQGLPLLVGDPVALARLAVLLTNTEDAADADAVGGPRRHPQLGMAVTEPVGTGAGPEPTVKSNHLLAAASVNATAAQAPDTQHAIATPTA